MIIDFANLQIQYQKYKTDIDTNIQRVLDKSNYIMGQEVHDFEGALETFTGAKHAIGCSSGTDALLLAMMALDIQPGDEVITTPFTFVATAETIAQMKAVPVFVDIEPDTFNMDANKIEAVITDKTKVIMPVSLYGQPADMETIRLIAEKNNLKVIVDGAQSFGSTYGGSTDSNLGDMSTTSFFPAKPLGCYGDGGAIFTNNCELAEKIEKLRLHGQSKQYHHKYIGMGGRLDTIQAAILLAKLPHYKNDIEARNKIALRYTNALSRVFKTPVVKTNRSSVWAQYTIRILNRDRVQEKLKLNGIPTAIYYPVPLHLQECFQYLNYKVGDFPHSEKASKEVMSIPINPYLTSEEVNYIVECLCR